MSVNRNKHFSSIKSKSHQLYSFGYINKTRYLTPPKFQTEFTLSTSSFSAFTRLHQRNKSPSFGKGPRPTLCNQKNESAEAFANYPYPTEFKKTGRGHNFAAQTVAEDRPRIDRVKGRSPGPQYLPTYNLQFKNLATSMHRKIDFQRLDNNPRDTKPGPGAYKCLREQIQAQGHYVNSKFRSSSCTRFDPPRPKSTPVTYENVGPGTHNQYNSINALGVYGCSKFKNSLAARISTTPRNLEPPRSQSPGPGSYAVISGFVGKSLPEVSSYASGSTRVESRLTNKSYDSRLDSTYRSTTPLI